MTCPAVIEVITPGPVGPAGPTGPAGVGSAWLQGAGAPGGEIGAEGDFYLDTETGDIYGPRAEGSWGAVVFNIAEGQQGPAGPVGATGAAGPAGADGRTLLNGTSAPSNATGANGDFFINTAASIIYGPKAGGAWPAGVSLIGPAGGTGATGPTGPAGAAASVNVGTVTTGAPGSPATVTNTGTSSAAVLAFSIPRGDTGATGPAGSKGDPGADGAAATVAVGSVTTGAAGSNASVTNTGSSSAAVLDFTIPRGDTGATGAAGPAGTAATIAVGTVNTGAAGSSVSVSNAGTSSAAVLNFTIPRGDKGDKGDPGDPAPGTDLTYDAATREVRSSTGADAVLPLVTASAAGLVPAFTSATGKVFTDGGWATPSAATPGGSSGQLQWNNGGAFAGLSSSSIDGSGNLTFSARWIQSVNGAASAPPLALTGTWFTGGTATTTKPHFLIEPAGTSSTAWSINGTGLGVNAPSGFTGNLLDLQVNGSSRFLVSSSGRILNLDAQVATLGNGGFFSSNAIPHVRIARDYSYAWTNDVNSASAGTVDLQLFRDAANILAQRNATNAQTFRLYNTFTSATNFERLNVRWTSNEAILDCEAGSGGGTLRGLKIGSASTSLLGFYGATPVDQPAAVTDATDASTVITQLNALLSRLRTIGLIAT